jgi:hypothetical protein
MSKVNLQLSGIIIGLLSNQNLFLKSSSIDFKFERQLQH